MNQSGIQKAIDAAGSQKALAGVLDVSAEVISMWRKRGWMPFRRSMEVENLFGVPRSDTCSPAMSGFLKLTS